MNKNYYHIKYKPPKTTDEMIDYLYKYKFVRYSSISKDQAALILLKYNYINVVTPFKYKFAKVDRNHKTIKIDDKYVYDRPIEFNEYYSYYKKEREKYVPIYRSISTFETIFKSIVSYTIVNNREILDSNDLFDFLEEIKNNLKKQINYSAKRISHSIDNINNIEKDLLKYYDIYCLFDKLSLGQLLSLYTGLDNNTKIKIFLKMKELDMSFDVNNTSQFIDKIFTLVSIRNCIMHCNSLEILIRFYDPKNKSLRKSSDKRKFINMINYLCKEKQSCDKQDC